MDSVLGDLYNDLMCLCEVRGELSYEGNLECEARIAAIRREIEKLEKCDDE